LDAGQLTNLIVALATLVTAVTALVKVWKTKTKIDDSVAKLDNVEQLVNGNHGIALARIDQLGETLINAGVAIPKQPKIETGESNAV
jgi:hypothetical protein